MSELSKLLQRYAVESGAVPVDPEGLGGELTQDVLAEQVDAPQSEIMVQSDLSESSGEIADHLDDIAERAESLAATEDQSVSTDVSAESLHREFGIVMRANRLSFQASSFEAAGSDRERLTGLARDARRTADIARAAREAARDYSTEGKFLEWLNGDKRRLRNAGDALRKSVNELADHQAQFSHVSVLVSHDGVRRFMTIEDKPAHDMKAAVATTTGVLDKIHSAIVDGQQKITDIANKLARGNVENELKELEHGNHFEVLNNLETAKGGMLGNFSVVKKAGGGKIPGLTIPVYSRVNEHKFDGKSAAKAVAGGIFRGIVYGIVTAAAQNNQGQQQSTMSRIASDHLGQSASQGAAKLVGARTYDERVNASKEKSAASFADLIHIAAEIESYKKYLEFRVSEDNLSSAIKDARKNGSELDAEARKQLSAACSDLENTLDRLVRLRTVAYEQALYMTVMMSGVISDVVKKLK